MTGEISSKVIAACFALAAFAVAIFAGLATSNPAGDVLLRAVVSMIVCYPVGTVAGLICQRVIATQLALRNSEQTSDETLDAAQLLDGQARTHEDVLIV
jgi:hypothetical protein